MKTETIFSHYVRVDINEDGTFDGVWLVEEIFHHSDYLREQVKWALRCSFNRNAVRVKMGWSDEELDKNPDVLVNNFIAEHGDDWFRENLRPKFITIKRQKLEGVSPGCFFTRIQLQCQKCPVCKIARPKESIV